MSDREVKNVDCLLTLVFPPSLEENVIGLLLEHPQWAARFVCAHVEGHGQAMTLSASSDLVRGRAPRLMVQLVTGHDEVRALLAAFRESVPSHEVAYWVVELAQYGRLA
jgi:hypothetical protein